MTIENLHDLFLWCTVVNYGILMVWSLVFICARQWLRQLHGRWFRISDDQFDVLHYAGMSIYKIGIFLLNLVPLISLWIVV